MIDNYDSFTYNIVQYLGELGSEPTVYRNDKMYQDVHEAQGVNAPYSSKSPCGEPGSPNS